VSLEDALRDLAMAKAAELGDAFVDRARAEAPERTGTLAASIHADGPADNGSSVTVHASVDAPYAIFVERGRGPQHAPPGGAIPLTDAGVVVSHVGPAAANPFWERTMAAWAEIVGSVE
jgi:Bacteriophage HK97-gp10, putative tail-component